MLGAGVTDALGNTKPLGLVRLTGLTDLSEGDRDFQIGLVDGPVDVGHRELGNASIHHLGDIACRSRAATAAMTHATFAAGILVGRRGGGIPALVPRCSLLVGPIFGAAGCGNVPSASPADLASALARLIDAGARVINVSAELVRAMPDSERRVGAALDHAACRGVLIVAAMGNRGRLGGSALTRHPWVIPVVACDLSGAPAGYSNLSLTSARHGVRAPGEGMSGPVPYGDLVRLTGSSVAALLVTGAIALVWSLHPWAASHVVRAAILGSARPAGIVPPLLDAWRANLILRNREEADESSFESPPAWIPLGRRNRPGRCDQARHDHSWCPPLRWLRTPGPSP
jgi:subtilisin family serine protease